MTVLCPRCRRAIRIPPDKAVVPNLRARCGGCQTVFAVSEASIASQAPEATAPPPGPPVPSSAPATPSPATDEPQAPAPPARPPARPLPSPAGEATRPPGSAPATPSPARAAAPPARTTATPARVPSRPPSWRRCANHPQARSETYCPACRKGLCHDCSRPFQNAFICPECDGLCVTAAEQEARETRERERARPLREDLQMVLRYPLVDPLAYVLLAIFVWGFRVAAALAAFGGGFGALFSQGLLMAYAFTAVNRISSGNTKSFMPSISDISDLIVPVRLGFAVLLISAGPLLALLFLLPVQRALSLSEARPALLQTVHAQEPAAPPTAEPGETEEGAVGEEDVEEADESQPGEGAQASPEPDIDSLLLGPPPDEAAEPEAPLVPAWGWVLVVIAFAWNIVYAPVALTVAAISQSFLQTLNPVLGIDTIRRMGTVYWQAMSYYTAITAVQLLLGFGFGLVPILGGIVRAFVDSWALLSIGCLLGRAVFKKAAELGLD